MKKSYVRPIKHLIAKTRSVSLPVVLNNPIWLHIVRQFKVLKTLFVLPSSTTQGAEMLVT